MLLNYKLEFTLLILVILMIKTADSIKCYNCFFSNPMQDPNYMPSMTTCAVSAYNGKQCSCSSTYTYSEGILISVMSSIACTNNPVNGFGLNMNHNSNNNPLGSFGLTLNIHLYCHTDLCNNYTYTNIPLQIASQLKQIPNISGNLSYLNKVMAAGQRHAVYATNLAMDLTGTKDINNMIYKLSNTTNIAEFVMKYADYDDITILSEYLSMTTSENGTKKVRLVFNNQAKSSIACINSLFVIFFINILITFFFNF